MASFVPRLVGQGRENYCCVVSLKTCVGVLALTDSAAANHRHSRRALSSQAGLRSSLRGEGRAGYFAYDKKFYLPVGAGAGVWPGVMTMDTASLCSCSLSATAAA